MELGEKAYWVNEKVGHEKVGSGHSRHVRGRRSCWASTNGGNPQTGDLVLGSLSIQLPVASQILQRHRQQMFHAVLVRAFESLNRTQEGESFFEGSDGGLLCFGHL